MDFSKIGFSTGDMNKIDFVKSHWKPRSAKAYIQNGLIAQWDGIENAGYDIHDPNSVTWKELKNGNYDLTLMNNAQFSSNAFITDNQFNMSAKGSTAVPYSQVFTTEYVFHIRGTQKFASNVNFRYYLMNLCSNIYTSGYMMDMRSISYQHNLNGSAYGWMFKAESYIKASSDQPTIDDYCFSLLYTNSYNSDPVFYKNGILQNVTWSKDGAASAPPFIGCSSNGGKYGIYADIYSIRFYNRQLTANEIMFNHEIDKLRFNLS